MGTPKTDVFVAGAKLLRAREELEAAICAATEWIEVECHPSVMKLLSAAAVVDGSGRCLWTAAAVVKFGPIRNRSALCVVRQLAGEVAAAVQPHIAAAGAGMLDHGAAVCQPAGGWLAGRPIVWSGYEGPRFELAPLSVEDVKTWAARLPHLVTTWESELRRRVRELVEACPRGRELLGELEGMLLQLESEYEAALRTWAGRAHQEPPQKETKDEAWEVGAGIIHARGVPIPLNGTEFEVLALLLKCRPTFATHAEIQKILGKPVYDGVNPRAVQYEKDVMSDLRKALKAAGVDAKIKSISGQGYKLVG